MEDSTYTTSKMLKSTNKATSVGLRAPKCTRCRNHGMISDLRGHKHKCFWRDCTCRKCLISSDRQRATADRIALYRQQVRQSIEDERQHSFDRINASDKDCVTKNDSSEQPGSKRKRTPDEQLTTPPPTLTEETPYIALSKSPYLSKSDQSFSSTRSFPRWWEKSEEAQIKNMEILKYIFPFYDTESLMAFSRGCHDDMLQTVLSISSYVLDTRKASVTDDYHEKSPPHSPTQMNIFLDNDRCCSSPLCPVNTYLQLRKTSPSFLHWTPPPLTRSLDYKYDWDTESEKLSPEFKQRPTKKFHFSFEDIISSQVDKGN